MRLWWVTPSANPPYVFLCLTKKFYYLTCTGICPGLTTLITPAQLHINLQVLFNVGIFPINTVTDPGIQGLIVIGIHGIGVNTPNAAVVAAATIGLASDVHMAKGKIFFIGHMYIIMSEINLLSGAVNYWKR